MSLFLLPHILNHFVVGGWGAAALARSEAEQIQKDIEQSVVVASAKEAQVRAAAAEEERLVKMTMKESMGAPAGAAGPGTGACTDNPTCAQQYVGKSQSCMVISVGLIVDAPVARSSCM